MYCYPQNVLLKTHIQYKTSMFISSFEEMSSMETLFNNYFQKKLTSNPNVDNKKAFVTELNEKYIK